MNLITALDFDIAELSVAFDALVAKIIDVVPDEMNAFRHLKKLLSVLV